MILKFSILIYSILFIQYCQGLLLRQQKNKPTTNEVRNENDLSNLKKDSLLIFPAYNAYEERLLDAGFVDVQSLDTNILISLYYATKNNFCGEVLYDSLKHAFLRIEAAEKLIRAQQELSLIFPDYRLIVLDALRPKSIQSKMWDKVKGTEKQKYVADIKTGSLHNYGLAVDISIFDFSKDSFLDMGSQFDEFSELAQYRFNQKLVLENKLTEQQVVNRLLLRKIMRSAGFYAIETEWWHFEALKIEVARDDFEMIP